MNGKLYIVFGDTGGIFLQPVEHKTIERLDVKALTQGQSVNWEKWELPPEHYNLMLYPIMAPISETEIISIRFGFKNTL